MSKRRQNLLRHSSAVSAVIIALLGSTSAFAQAEPGNSNGQDDAVVYLFKTLHAKGILSDSEYQMAVSRLQPASAVHSLHQSAQNGVSAAPTDVSDNSATQVSAAGAEAPPATGVEKSIKGSLGDVKLTGSVGNGVGIQIGDVAVKVHASVNGFYEHLNGSPNTPDHQISSGTAAPGQASSAIRSGFAPGYIVTDITTTQRGLDIGAHFGFYPGIDSVGGTPNLAGVPQRFNIGGLDIRQVNLTVGRADIGEFKIGRDIGLFGGDAELNDIALLGVGTPNANPAPTNSTLGRIGTGYIYMDYQPQITYTSPSVHGFKLAVGAFQPLQTVGTNEINSTPGFQGKLTYEYKSDAFSAFLWSSAIIQKHDATPGSFGRTYTGKGIDFGAKLGLNGFGLTGYYYTSSALGIIGLFDVPLADNLNKRDSHGYYVQGTYKIGRLQFGGSYGGSFLSLADDEPISDLVKHNTSWYGQVRYSLTDWVTLVGEYVETRSKAYNGNSATTNAVGTGAVLAF